VNEVECYLRCSVCGEFVYKVEREPTGAKGVFANKMVRLRTGCTWITPTFCKKFPGVPFERVEGADARNIHTGG